MKKILFSLFAGIFSLALSAQVTFERHYGSPSTLDAFTSAAHTPDGGWLFAGSTVNFGSEGLDVLLVRTDAQGDTLWLRTWGGAGDQAANSIQVAQTGGGYFVCGYSAGIDSARDILVLRIDEYGQEVWHKTFGGNDDDIGVSVVALNDGGAVAVGRITSGTQKLFAVRLDASGATLWLNQYGAYSFQLDNVIGAVPTTDRLIIAEDNCTLHWIGWEGIDYVASTFYDPEGLPLSLGGIQLDPDSSVVICGYSYSGKPYFAKLNDFGDITLFQNLQLDSIFLSSGQLKATNAVMLSDGERVISFLNEYSLTATPEQLALAIFDPVTDTIVWTATREEAGLTGLEPASQILAQPDGGFLLTGSTITQAEGEDAVFNRYAPDGSLVWKKRIGVSALSDEEYGYKVLQTADGGFLALGSKVTAANGVDFWLIKTNAAGDVQWEGTYGFPDDERPADIDAAPGGGYFVAGSDGGSQLRVLKVGNSGLLEWLRDYNAGLRDVTFTLRSTPDGGCALVFPSSTSDTSMFSHGQLMKLNSSGDSLWSKFYKFSSMSTYTYGLALLGNGDFALAGGIETDDGHYWPLVFRTDANGGLLWYKVYDPQDQFGFLFCIQTIAGGGYVAQGIRATWSGQIKSFVLHTNSDGQQEWLSKPDDPDASFVIAWQNAQRIGSDEIFLFEQKNLYPPSGLPYQDHWVGSIQKLDGQGQLLCDENFGEGHTTVFLGGTATTDGGAAAIGSGIFDQSRDMFLVKVKADCTVGFQTPLSQPFDLQIAPNPSAGPFVLTIPSDASGPVEVKIVNAAGGEMLHWQGRKAGSAAFEKSFDLGTAPDGLYFVWVKFGAAARSAVWVKMSH